MGGKKSLVKNSERAKDKAHHVHQCHHGTNASELDYHSCDSVTSLKYWTCWAYVEQCSIFLLTSDKFVVVLGLLDLDGLQS